MFKMDIEKIWNESKWTAQARQIIRGLKNFPEDSKITLILRHSRRNEPKILDNLHNIRLTPEGHAIAKEFGRLLPVDREIRLFHSIIMRCEETAENILSGFENIGGKGKIIGAFSPLYDIRASSDFLPNLLKKYNIYQFFFRWAADLFPPDQIISMQKYCQNAAKLIWSEINNSPDRTIDIHVTHDIIIIAFKLKWFGFPPKKRWVSFLGGFALTFEKNNILLLDSGNLVSAEIPYWWEN